MIRCVLSPIINRFSLFQFHLLLILCVLWRVASWRDWQWEHQGCPGPQGRGGPRSRLQSSRSRWRQSWEGGSPCPGSRTSASSRTSSRGHTSSARTRTAATSQSSYSNPPPIMTNVKWWKNISYLDWLISRFLLSKLCKDWLHCMSYLSVTILSDKW